jgi:hypothetical protein
MLLQLYTQSQTPQGNILVEQLKQEGYNFKFGELFKRIVSNSGIQDWDKILEEQSEEEKTETTLETDAQQFQNALGQVQPNINQVPEQQQQQPKV